nr:hypothetical protein [Tanacetum cinerariifolium]GEZ66180.1 hypothetical protein [Tanacetum cinerariifolium]
EDGDLYNDVSVRSLGAEQGQERKESVPLAVDEVTSIMNVKSHREESSTQAPSLFSIPVTAIPETATAHAVTILPTISMITPPLQLMIPSPAPVTIPTTTSILALLEFSSLDRDDKDKDKDSSARLDRGLKKRKTSKDVKPPIGSKSKEYKTRPSFNLLKETCKSFVEQEYHFEECYKAATDQLDWNNPKAHEYPFDLSKPLSLIEAQGRQVVHADYFFNNDLEYLKDRSLSRKYTTSTTKNKATKYDNIKGIKDMVPELWSPVKVAYNKFSLWVTHVKVMKWYGYGYLEEIIIIREDQSLHKFKEGDFPRLNLCDIEDLLLLLVQKKLSNLKQDVIFDLNVALRMFTRRIVILKRVKDLQLGVKSY